MSREPRDLDWSDVERDAARMESRHEHLQWCKRRALEEFDHSGSVSSAVTSMISDLGKHPETAGHGGILLLGMLLVSGNLQTRADLEREIGGFR